LRGFQRRSDLGGERTCLRHSREFMARRGLGSRYRPSNLDTGGVCAIEDE
jgi:hypothetical protein